MECVFYHSLTVILIVVKGYEFKVKLQKVVFKINLYLYFKTVSLHEQWCGFSVLHYQHLDDSVKRRKGG